MTNAQAALQAAAESLAFAYRDYDKITARAEKFKQWLDEQDEIDRKKNSIGMAVRTYGEV